MESVLEVLPPLVVRTTAMPEPAPEGAVQRTELDAREVTGKLVPPTVTTPCAPKPCACSVGKELPCVHYPRRARWRRSRGGTKVVERQRVGELRLDVVGVVEAERARARAEIDRSVAAHLHPFASDEPHPALGLEVQVARRRVHHRATLAVLEEEPPRSVLHAQRAVFVRDFKFDIEGAGRRVGS